MKKINNIYKKIGETPLQRLERYRRKKNISKPMTYLGRLDPMAQGVLLIAPGSISQKDREKILALPKTYTFKVLFGFSSDTFDFLGIAKKHHFQNINNLLVKHIATSVVGSYIQKYPYYSSKPIGGIPLFELSRNKTIKEKDLPEKKVEVYTCTHLHTKKIKSEKILIYIEKQIKKVKGDFRQEKIIKQWRKLLSASEFCVVSTLSAEVSSGTYVRSIAHDMGKKLNTGALALGIKRTSVGPYSITDSER